MNYEEIMKSGQKQKSSFGCEVKSIDEEKKTIEVVMSSDSVDRHREIVLQSGMIIPKQTKSLTVFVDHNYTVEKAVGKVDVKTIVTKGDKTSGTIQFATDISPLAELTFKLMKEGYITDVSIGFIPKAYDRKKVKDGEKEIEVWRWTEWEITELSVVGIGSNRDAFKKAFKDGKINEEELKSLGVEYKDEKGDNTLERALEIFEKNHSITKSYRKAFEKMRKLLGVEPEKEEDETINKTFDKFTDTLKELEQANPDKTLKEHEKGVKTISGSELLGLVKGL